MLLAFKQQLHNPFLWKERKINSIIAVIAFLVIASLVAPYSHSYHSASPHPEWNTPCGADLSLPLFGNFQANSQKTTTSAIVSIDPKKNGFDSWWGKHKDKSNLEYMAAIRRCDKRPQSQK